MDQVRGDGFAAIEEDDTVSGEIPYHNGDESSFTPILSWLQGSNWGS